MTKNLAHYLTRHWLIILIVVIATWLRVWQLDTNAILIGDAAHDILSAITAVEEKSLPLLGIESSVPRFKQGPVAVWLHMAIHIFAAQNLYWHWLLFALIGIAAVIATYELGQLYFNSFTAHLASWLVAVSPLAIAHSRMAYHITPIPVMTVLFLAACIRLQQEKKYGFFWAVLSWAGLFQFELAAAPLLLVVLFLVWRQKKLMHVKTLLEGVVGISLGLWPQIIVDLTTGFSHLGGFITWVGYRVASATPVGGHAISLASITSVGKVFFTYFGRIFTVNSSVVTSLVLSFLALATYFNWQKIWFENLKQPIFVVFISTIVLIGSFIIHGSPSEAYFPPFIILLPLLLAHATAMLERNLQRVAVFCFVALSITSIYQTSSASFFNGPFTGFSYGYSLGEQKEIVAFTIASTNNQFSFRTTHPSGKFSNYFDNLRLLTWQLGSKESPTGRAVYIEVPNQSQLQQESLIPSAVFPNANIYIEP